MNRITITERPNVKTSELLDECRKKFSVWSYYDDERLDKEFPAPKEATQRSFRDRVEADEEHKNKSGKELNEAGIQGITLRERIIMELDYFERTGKHLDIDNGTICSGSPFEGGGFPFLDWGGGELRLGVIGPDAADGSWRVREVVSPVALDPRSPNPSALKRLENIIKEVEEIKKLLV